MRANGSCDGIPGLGYVLPLRRAAAGDDLPELGAYLARIARVAEVLVVDGSPSGVFAAHARAMPDGVLHVRVDGPRPGANGKVRAVTLGVRRTRAERVVIADDDVRYSEDALRAMAQRLRRADLVVPQNHFEPLPWHARWDGARSLINRALGGDYPGTLGVRRSTLLAIGGYDERVLFENLELMRTVAAHGGRVVRAPSLLVARRPPKARHFLSQRVRQAYDDLATPGRMAVELALGPTVAALALRRRPRALAALAACATILAELGRRRGGAARAFPPSCSLLAPGWLLERAACAWLAVAYRAAGGMPYAGTVLRRSANAPRVLRRRAVTATPRTRGSPAAPGSA